MHRMRDEGLCFACKPEIEAELSRELLWRKSGAQVPLDMVEKVVVVHLHVDLAGGAVGKVR